MYAFKLIVGKSLDNGTYGMDNVDDIYGTVIPNYIGGALIDAFMVTTTGDIGLKTDEKIGGAVSVDLAFASGLTDTLTWDDTKKAYISAAPNTAVGDYLSARKDEVVEFVLANFGDGTKATTPKTPTPNTPPPAPPADEPCDVTPKKKPAKKPAKKAKDK